MIKKFSKEDFNKVSGGIIAKLDPDKETLSDFSKWSDDRLPYLSPDAFDRFQTQYVVCTDDEPHKRVGKSFKTLDEAKTFAEQNGFNTNVKQVTWHSDDYKY